jgi:hypothetical protein
VEEWGFDMPNAGWDEYEYWFDCLDCKSGWGSVGPTNIETGGMRLTAKRFKHMHRGHTIEMRFRLLSSGAEKIVEKKS